MGKLWCYDVHWQEGDGVSCQFVFYLCCGSQRFSFLTLVLISYHTPINLYLTVEIFGSPETEASEGIARSSKAYDGVAASCYDGVAASQPRHREGFERHHFYVVHK